MIVDFMPPRGKASDVVRLVRGMRGQVAMRTELVVRFDYGSIVPWVTRLDDGSLRAIGGPNATFTSLSMVGPFRALRSNSRWR